MNLKSRRQLESTPGETQVAKKPRQIVLISCVKSKGKQPAQSQDLYESDLFRKSLAYARCLRPDAIYILSAKYHLLDLDRQIEWYDKTLNKMKIADVNGLGRDRAPATWRRRRLGQR